MQWLSTELQCSPTKRHHPPRRGIATIEAILILAVLAILWGGVRYVTALGLEHLRAEEHARSCAWRIASTGCQEIPDDCQAKEEAETPSPKMGQLPNHDGAAQQHSANQEVQSATDAAISGLFFKRTETSSGGEVSRPAILGGESVEVAGSHTLPCNQPPAPTENLARRLFSVFTR